MVEMSSIEQTNNWWINHLAWTLN